GQPHLGDGSRYSDRRGACRDASGRSAPLLSGRNPQGAALQIGKSSAHAPLASCPRGRGRQASAAGPGTLRAGAKPRAHSQGTCHAPAQAQVEARLKQISAMDLDREELLMKLGAARGQARAAWRLIDIEVAPHRATFSFALNRKKLRQ